MKQGLFWAVFAFPNRLGICSSALTMAQRARQSRCCLCLLFAAIASHSFQARICRPEVPAYRQLSICSAACSYHETPRQHMHTGAAGEGLQHSAGDSRFICLLRLIQSTAALCFGFCTLCTAHRSSSVQLIKRPLCKVVRGILEEGQIMPWHDAFWESSMWQDNAQLRSTADAS